MAVSSAEYLKTYFAANDAIVDAIAEAKGIARDRERSDSDQLAARAMMVDLEAQRAMLETHHNFFMGRFDTIKAPDEPVVNRAIEVAKQLAGEVARNILAEGKLEAIVNLVDAFGQAVKKQPAGAGAAALQSVSATALAAAKKRQAKMLAATTTAWLKRRLAEA